MQALDDAICWRTGRLAEPCGDCATAPDGRCDDHDRDLSLIAAYHLTARNLRREAGETLGVPLPAGAGPRVAAAPARAAAHHQSAAMDHGAPEAGR